MCGVRTMNSRKYYIEDIKIYRCCVWYYIPIWEVTLSMFCVVYFIQGYFTHIYRLRRSYGYVHICDYIIVISFDIISLFLDFFSLTFCLIYLFPEEGQYIICITCFQFIVLFEGTLIYSQGRKAVYIYYIIDLFYFRC